MHYLDTSAWVKVYYVERGTPWMRRLFEQGERFACASLGVVEATAALARKAKAGSLGAAELRELLDSVEEHWDDFVHVDLFDEVIAKARELAGSRWLRGSDAVHLASACVIRAELLAAGDDIDIVTSDAELIQAAIAEGFSVTNPEAVPDAPGSP